MGVFQCDNCPKVFGSKKFLEIHQTNKCRKSSPAARSAKKIKKEKQPKPQCDICNKIFVSDAFLEQHYLTHKETDALSPTDRLLKSPVKEPEDDTVKNLQNVADQNNETPIGENKSSDSVDGPPWYCEKCNVTFAKEVSFRRHNSNHEKMSAKEKNPALDVFTCTDCGITLESVNAITYHYNRVHLVRKPRNNTSSKQEDPSIDFGISSNVVKRKTNNKLASITSSSQVKPTSPAKKRQQQNSQVDHQDDSSDRDISINSYELETAQTHKTPSPKRRPQRQAVTIQIDSETKVVSIDPQNMPDFDDFGEQDDYDDDYDVNDDISQDNDDNDTAADDDEDDSDDTDRTGDDASKTDQKGDSESNKKYRFKCDKCNKRFKKWFALYDHVRNHDNLKSFKCFECGKKFNRQLELTHHRKAFHPHVKPYSCQYCQKQFGDHGVLRRHTLIHTQQKDYICEICAKAFLTLSDLKSHKYIHSDAKPYKCSYCDKMFKRPENVKQHVEHIHIKSKWHQCSICDSKFVRKQSLMEHLKLHAKINTHFCDVCDMGFTSSSLLTKHRRAKHDRHTCLICAKSYSRKHDLAVHMRTHNGQRPFCCKVCDMTFYTKHNLVRHQLLHSIQSSIKKSQKGKEEKEGKGERIEGDKDEERGSEGKEGEGKEGEGKEGEGKEGEGKEGEGKEMEGKEKERDAEKLKKDGEELEHESEEEGNNSEKEGNEQEKKGKERERDESSQEQSNDGQTDNLGEKETVKPVVQRSKSTHLHECDTCGMMFLKKYNYERHLREVCATQPVECNICGAVRPNAAELRDHIEAQHYVSCNHCHIKFTSRETYLEHYAEAHPDRSEDFTCDICGEQFTRASSLKEHREKHPEARDYKCTKCSARFTRERTLHTHMLSHADVERHRCEFCDSAFYLPSQLQKHMKTRHNEHGIKCPICPRVFQTTSIMNKHQKVHQNIAKPYLCNICMIGFSAEGYKMRHMKRFHPEEFTAENIEGENDENSPSESASKTADDSTVTLHIPETVIENVDNNLNGNLQLVRCNNDDGSLTYIVISNPDGPLDSSGGEVMLEDGHIIKISTQHLENGQNPEKQVIVESDQVVTEPNHVELESGQVIVEQDQVVAESNQIVADSEQIVVDSNQIVVDSNQILAESDIPVDSSIPITELNDDSVNPASQDNHVQTPVDSVVDQSVVSIEAGQVLTDNDAESVVGIECPNLNKQITKEHSYLSRGQHVIYVSPTDVILGNEVDCIMEVCDNIKVESTEEVELQSTNDSPASLVTSVVVANPNAEAVEHVEGADMITTVESITLGSISRLSLNEELQRDLEEEQEERELEEEEELPEEGEVLPEDCPEDADEEVILSEAQNNAVFAALERSKDGTVQVIQKREQLHKCRICGNSYLSKRQLTCHFKMDHPTESHLHCDKCNMDFKCKSAFRRHQVKHMTVKTHTCHLCGKSFYMKDSLKKHLLSHQDNMPYQCHECGKKFKYKGSMQKHMVIHQGEKEFECNICQKRFYHETQLKEHLARHYNIRPHACDVCQQRFVTNSCLARHRKIHLKPSKRKGRPGKNKKNVNVTDVTSLEQVAASGEQQQQQQTGGNVVTLEHLQLVVAEEIMNGELNMVNQTNLTE